MIAGEDAPCIELGIIQTTSEERKEMEVTGPPCLMQMGMCLTCGFISGLPWSAMHHEIYGLFYAKENRA